MLLLGDRVQYFRAEAEMLRWLEEYERKQAQFMRCIRSFSRMAKIWLQLADNSEHPNPGYGAHARKTASRYQKLCHDARQRFSAAGYKHRVDSMDLIDPPLLSDMIQADREALKLESTTVESLLCYPVAD